MKCKLKIIIAILSVLLLISIALNGFLINKIYKFKQAVITYKVYADELYTKLNDIQQKVNKIEHNVKNTIKKNLKDR